MGNSMSRDSAVACNQDSLHINGTVVYIFRNRHHYQSKCGLTDKQQLQSFQKKYGAPTFIIVATEILKFPSIGLFHLDGFSDGFGKSLTCKLANKVATETDTLRSMSGSGSESGRKSSNHI